MLIKELTIDGKTVRFRASAAVPRLYRAIFKKDILQDISKLQTALVKVNKGEQFPIEALETFENLAYIMAKHGDERVPSNIDKWLETFDTFSIYEILPEILQLWTDNEYAQVESKKKLNQVAGS